MSERSCGGKKRAVLPVVLGALAGIPLLGLAYVAAVPGNMVAFQIELLLSGKGSVKALTNAITDEAKRPEPLAPEAMALFRSFGKGPRADQYLEVVTTTYAPKKPIVAALLTGDGGLKSGALVNTDAITRSAKADRLNQTFSQVALKGPLSDGRGTDIFMRPTLDEEEFAFGRSYDGMALLQWAVLKPLEEKEEGVSYKGETEAEFRARERRCLATAIYFEARGEPVRGQLAVAQVVMNRVRSPKFPDTVCGVVYQGQFKKGCQFSFTCDGKSDNPDDDDEWTLAQELAEQVTTDQVWLPEVDYSTFYHANYVRPRWARSMNKIDKIGAHIFYKKRHEEPYVVTVPHGDVQVASDEEINSVFTPSLVHQASATPTTSSPNISLVSSSGGAPNATPATGLGFSASE
ncbi:Spore cortex-lytic enzyme precursor [Methyloligella halotolerans]|uniref:Spore cortex-lytic enzyme n=1 Tax=Methyloligella halotolerans TaxID=1177755 RepID=A0A1E2RYH1_9HYPH|nr:cell wall hydrolase [Methyloligella halotolerans]ODA67286.1 Spore cortex-lytic enzyme precursor [Methyloligella halotolerans]